MNWTILDGEPSSAVTLFRMGPGLDDGDILMQRAFAIGESDYVGDVARRVYELTEELVAESVSELSSESAQWSPQDHSKATYTRRRRPADGHIEWRESSVRIRNLIRATSHPFPGAFTLLGQKVVRIWRGDISWSQVLRSGAVELQGPERVRRAIPGWFPPSAFAAVPRPELVTTG